MICFKQKQYVAPAVVAAIPRVLGIASTAMGLKDQIQGSAQAKEQAEQAAEEQRRHNREMEKVAREKAQQEKIQAQQTQQKEFNMISLINPMLGKIQDSAQAKEQAEQVAEEQRRHNRSIKKESRQKEFNMAAIASKVPMILNTAQTVAGINQGFQANKLAKEQAEEAAREEKRHNKAMERNMLEAAQKQYSKEQALSLLPYAMSIAQAGATIHQGYQMNKLSKQNLETSAKETRRHNKKLEEIERIKAEAAAKGKIPMITLPAGTNVNPEYIQQREYGFVGTAVKGAKELVKKIGNSKAGGLAKDLTNIHKSSLKDLAGFGASMAAFNYAGNRIATSMKNRDEGHNEKNKKALKRALITSASLGTAYLGAKKGLLGEPIQNFTKEELVKYLKMAKDGLIPKSAFQLILNSAFASIPIVTYLNRKSHEKDAIDNAVQDTYSDSETGDEKKKSKKLKKALVGLGAVSALSLATRKGLFGNKAQIKYGGSLFELGKLLKNNLKLKKVGSKFIEKGVKAVIDSRSLGKDSTKIGKRAAGIINKKVNVGELVTGGINEVLTTLGGVGKGGTKAVQNTGKKLAQSDNELSKKLGEWIIKKDANGNLVNSGKANLAAALASVAAMGAAFDAGRILVDTPLKVVDPDTFKSIEEDEEKVYSDIKFKQKECSSKVKDAASLALSSAALAVSTANMLTNKKRYKNTAQYEEEHLNALKDLTSSLKEANKNLEEMEEKNKKIFKEKKKSGDKNLSTGLKKIFKIKQKNNSNVGKYALMGANVGLGGGTFLAGFLPEKLGFDKKKVTIRETVDGKNITRDDVKFIKDSKSIFNTNKNLSGVQNFYNNKISENPHIKRALLSLGCAAIGAGIGSIIGLIADYTDHRNKAGNERLMKHVIENLKRLNFKDGIQYTLDPKMANLLKTRVTLVISRTADSLRLIINSVSDPKLKTVSENIIKNLPSMSTTNSKISDRFNEISITTLSSQENATFVSSVAERFIKEGFPVYLVEVG